MQIDIPSPVSLLELAQGGDCEAYSELCRQYETPLLRQALTLCGNESLAEELAQDTLVAGWKSLHRYNGTCQIFTWLCAILLNRYRNVLRRSHRAPFSFSADEECSHQVPDPGAAPDDEAQVRERALLLLDCVRCLPAKY